MKVISCANRYESGTGDRLLVEVQAVGSVYFETWSNGYKQYKEHNKETVCSNDIREILSELQLVDFDPTEIENFIHYSGCFYEE
ncbi:hypothetical protein Ac42p113 [Acinetobacter phage Ac42]|uniref:hypothetical protein n=1 Tax=Acinetobacter phage Ac42 TaxID=762660 RepID=UPI0001EBCD0B|nr:hypothetical protein Ac42p113 [Acinetobacter phage Ac42]ADI96351.1 hypothetical protein Ac42p113 [Acinetobacter phage Ac42]